MSAMQAPFLKSLLKLLSESNDASLDLDELTRLTGYSKYYLCRSFYAAAQEPLQTYLRRLRLARGAEALRRGERILDVALALGYQSQEAFHRAFVKMFNVTPKALQNGDHHPSLLLKRPWQEQFMPLPPLPCRQETLPGFELFGIGGTFDYEQLSQIELLWQDFHTAIPADEASYGVTLPCPEDAEKFRYFAATAHTAGNIGGLQKIRIPAQTYTVFRHTGAAETLLRAFNYIWGVWLPEQGQEVAGIDFEYYPPGYNPTSATSWMDIYIPPPS